MTRKRGVVAGTVAIAVLVLALNVLPSSAQTTPPPIASEFLTDRAVFPDDVAMKVKFRLAGTDEMRVVKVGEASRTLVGRFTVQPGAQFPWHTHPGPVFVNVVSGELTYISADDCVERPYPAGTAFVDPGQGHVHSAFNDTDNVTVFVATFFDAPAEGPLLIPASEACS